MLKEKLICLGLKWVFLLIVEYVVRMKLTQISERTRTNIFIYFKMLPPDICQQVFINFPLLSTGEWRNWYSPPTENGQCALPKAICDRNSFLLFITWQCYGTLAVVGHQKQQIIFLNNEQTQKTFPSSVVFICLGIETRDHGMEWGGWWAVKGNEFISGLEKCWNSSSWLNDSTGMAIF